MNGTSGPLEENSLPEIFETSFNHFLYWGEEKKENSLPEISRHRLIISSTGGGGDETRFYLRGRAKWGGTSAKEV